jgi:hypothetical protein
LDFSAKSLDRWWTILFIPIVVSLWSNLGYGGNIVQCHQAHTTSNLSRVHLQSLRQVPHISSSEVSIYVETKALDDQKIETSAYKFDYSDPWLGFLPRARDLFALNVTGKIRLGIQKFQEVWRKKIGLDPKSYSVMDWMETLAEVESGRIGFAIIRENEDHVFGMLQVYDGSIDRRESFAESDTSRLPFEKWLASHNLKTSYFDHLREQGIELMEFGTFLVEAEGLEREERTAIRRELLSWLLRTYLDPAHDSKRRFLIAVANEDLRFYYQKSFGALPIPADQLQVELGMNNSILMVDAKTFREQILKNLNN